MKYFNQIKDLKIDQPTVVTLGKFDGLHEGHRNLLETMFDLKVKKGYQAMIFTFDMQPLSLIKGKEILQITTNEEKKALFEELGIDYFIECPFTDHIMKMSPRDFVIHLVENLSVKAFVVGKDFHFGYQRMGDCNTLIEMSKEFGFEVLVKEKITYGDRDISSTFVREELAKGNMETAKALLGYPYFIENVIVEGNHIGRKMGIPTVNMEIDPGKVIPPKGVYASSVVVDGKEYYAVSNIGNKPTIGDNYPTGVETFILDFSGDLYNKKLRVYLLKYIRPEKRFENIDALKAQIESDIQTSKQYYENITKS